MQAATSKYSKKLLFLFLISISLSTSAQNLSNAGKEFWVAWGHNAVSAGFVLYITSDTYANINIIIPGTSFTPISDLIAPGQVNSYTISLPGLMLSNEGLINNKAIHIVSDVPVVAYAHQYAGQSSGATMLMPVESYGRTYYSLNMTQVTNVAPSYSYFFVIASEDNTTVEITPSVATVGGRSANTPFNVNLNKGQIYNVWGAIFGSGSTGNDVTGSKIKSVAGTDGICHPIGVFSGSSRITLIGSSGDVVEQQIFPAQAWGTRYLTSPTVSTTSTFTNNLNIYRVAVRDPSTIVKRNGVVLTGLQNNFFYQFQSNVPEYIQSDKPILVSQYIPSEGSANYIGNGDPEMFYLSPIEQGIRSARFNATKNQAITSNYVNVIVPTVSAASLRVDGTAFWDNIYPHPNLPGYTVKVKKFTTIPTGQANQQHSLTCDTTFTAITYGLGSAESYGYNAGTLINNLEVVTNIQNTGATVINTANTTCPNTPFLLKIRTVYNATQLQWLFSQVSNFSSPSNVNIPAPVADSTTIINGITYYNYSLPTAYQFSALGTYNIPIKIYNPSIDNCDSSITVMLPVQVGPGPSSNFTVGYTGCKLDTAILHGTPNANGFNLVRYRWTFDDRTTSQNIDTAKALPIVGVHPVRFMVQADNGCSGDTTINVTTYPNPTTNFGTTPASACIGSSVSFTDTSAFGGGPITRWFWNYGNGQTLNSTNGNVQTAIYNQPGDYIISHVVSASRCLSDTVRRIVHIWAKPQANFSFNNGCLQDSTTAFTSTSVVSDAQALNYSWNFGDANASTGNPNTSILQNPTHKYSNYNINQVQLVVTTANGCTDTITKPYSVSGFAPPVSYDVLSETKLCSKQAVTLKSTVNIAQDSIFQLRIYWDTLAQPTVYDIDNTPTQNELYQHSYTPFTTPATKQVTIKWMVYSRGGCVGVRTKTITLQATPVIAFGFIPGVCFNGATASAATATIVNSVTGSGYYFGIGIDSNGTVHPANTGAALATVSYAFTTDGGCTDTASQTIRIFPKPVAGFIPVTSVCIGDSILLRDSSSVSTGALSQWKWKFSTTDSLGRNSGANFYHTYNTSGSNSISLRVVSDSGCISDLVQKEVVTQPLPIANFSLPPFICMPAGNATFTNLSSIINNTPLQYSWSFGDGTNSTEQNPSHIYSTSSSYTVKLLVTSAAGCVKDTSIVLSTFYDKPIAAFGASSQFFCQGEPTTFRDSSSAPNSTITNWLWSFGDGSVSSIRNPTKRYIKYGLYDVSLVTKNAQGCTSDTAYKQIRVYLKPSVIAGPTPLTIAQGQQVLLQGLRNDSAVSIRWTPAGTLTNDTLLQPIAKPLVTTTYTITGTGEGNCTATSTVKVIVLNKIVIPNAFSPNGDGINDTWMIPDLNDYFGARVQVFDRYGLQVLQTIGYAQPWNGTFKNKPLPIGTYYYIIELNQLGYPPITGSVTILR